MKSYWFRAQAPRRVLAVAKHLGIAADLVEVDLAAGDLKSAEYAALNPNQTAPTLIDGGHVIWESSAIMAYLCIKAGSDMWPAHDATEQVEVLRWLSWNDCQWAPAIGPFYFERIVKPMFALGPPDEDAIQNCLGKFLRYARVLNSHLDGRTHVACGRLTIADFSWRPWRPIGARRKYRCGGFRRSSRGLSGSSNSRPGAIRGPSNLRDAGGLGIAPSQLQA